MKSVLQDWVAELGLRHQGVLVSAIRGCDLISRGHVSKKLARAFRAEILNSFNGDPTKCVSYIEVFSEGAFTDIVEEVTNDLDVYPVHYIMHFAHAAEIIAYKGPTPEARTRWNVFYLRVCKKLHLNPETEEQLDARLNADESTFAE